MSFITILKIIGLASIAFGYLCLILGNIDGFWSALAKILELLS